jgi:hypothetical protein
MTKLMLDGIEADLDQLSENGKKVYYLLQEVELRLKEKRNLSVLCQRAKQAFSEDLKQEILKEKASL